MYMSTDGFHIIPKQWTLIQFITKQLKGKAIQWGEFDLESVHKMSIDFIWLLLISTFAIDGIFAIWELKKKEDSEDRTNQYHKTSSLFFLF